MLSHLHPEAAHLHVSKFLQPYSHSSHFRPTAYSSPLMSPYHPFDYPPHQASPPLTVTTPSSSPASSLFGDATTPSTTGTTTASPSTYAASLYDTYDAPDHTSGSTGRDHTTVLTQPHPSPQLQQGTQHQQVDGSGKTYSFVSLPGNAVKKRPRRRYDEIERLYHCSWPDCTKAYGTLNHLNAHVTMQKHGSKRSPNEFKELRKQWRKAKKEEQEQRACPRRMSLRRETDPTGVLAYAQTSHGNIIAAPHPHHVSIHAPSHLLHPHQQQSQVQHPQHSHLQHQHRPHLHAQQQQIPHHHQMQSHHGSSPSPTSLGLSPTSLSIEGRYAQQVAAAAAAAMSMGDLRYPMHTAAMSPSSHAAAWQGAEGGRGGGYLNGGDSCGIYTSPV